MIKPNSTVRASCHCELIQLDCFLSNGVVTIIRCNCSICSRTKGLGMICVPLNNCFIIKGMESMTEYVCNTKTSPPCFLYICGTHPHHKSRTKPDLLCINISCINKLDVAKYDDKIIGFDGINHPKDLLTIFRFTKIIIYLIIFF